MHSYLYTIQKNFSKIIILHMFALLTIPLSTMANEYPNLNDGTDGISQGYGVWGDNNVHIEEPITVRDKGIITIYHPETHKTENKTVIFISGWSMRAESYDKIFKFIASHGYTVLNIYNFDNQESPGYVGNITVSYPNIIAMIDDAYINWGSWLGTRYVGIMGHSYGGGATFYVGDKLFTKRNWGSYGRFIFALQPWLPFLITQNDLAKYKSDTSLILQIADDDVSHDATESQWTWNTDESALRAVYQLINIPNANKDFIRVLSDKNTEYTYNDNTYKYIANHYITYTGNDDSYGDYQPYDTLDVYGVNRPLHALLDYSFEKNQNAHNTALGGGHREQISMGILPDLLVSDTQIITRQTESFKFKCASADGWSRHTIWKLYDFCTDTDSDGIIDYIEDTRRADTDGDNTITVTDAMLTLKFALDIQIDNTYWQKSDTTGDVNCDNSVTATDALLLLRYSLSMAIDQSSWCDTRFILNSGD